MNPRLRQFLLRSLRLALRLRSAPLSLSPGPLLVIAPHPDDETLGCGGLLLQRRRANLPATCLFLTRGEGSHQNHPLLAPAALAARRVDEARDATSLLGLGDQDLCFLGLPDGRLPQLDGASRETAIAEITAHLERLRPATVLVAHRHDGSSEHEAAFALVRSALARTAARPRVLDYLVWCAYSPRLLLREVMRRPGRVYRAAFAGLGPIKRRALMAHRSQFFPVPPWTLPAQPADFANAFSPEEEFFIEMPL
jgi:LmbE family N-acetylglucosaminyl deacetylase